MQIHLENIGKRYRRDWIFRGIDFQFNSGEKYAITGRNGSGKSTFLKVLSSHLTPTKGKINFHHAADFKNRSSSEAENGSAKNETLDLRASVLDSFSTSLEAAARTTGAIDSEKVFNSLAFAAPYIELLGEFTLREMLDFHLKFKNFQNNLTTSDLIELTFLEASAEKEIRFFSSGMKQRVKLAMAICSDSPLLLLDEPSTNLDREGIEWYRKLIKKYASDRTVIIASNVDEDFDFCENNLNILDYK